MIPSSFILSNPVSDILFILYTMLRQLEGFVLPRSAVVVFDP